MKKGEYVMKVVDNFTEGLLEVIHDYIEDYQDMEVMPENTMVEVAHALLSEFEFKVRCKESSESSEKMFYVKAGALPELCAKYAKLEGSYMHASPNPYNIVETGKRGYVVEKTIGGRCKSGSENSEKSTILSESEMYQKSDEEPWQICNLDKS